MKRCQREQKVSVQANHNMLNQGISLTYIIYNAVYCLTKVPGAIYQFAYKFCSLFQVCPDSFRVLSTSGRMCEVEDVHKGSRGFLSDNENDKKRYRVIERDCQL